MIESHKDYFEYRVRQKHKEKRTLIKEINEKQHHLDNRMRETLSYTIRCFEMLYFTLQRGKDNDIHVMIDAEQTYIQAALGYMVLLMQSVYNKEKCIVFNTYQCYRKVRDTFTL